MTRKKSLLIWFLVLAIVGGAWYPCVAWWDSYWTRQFEQICQEADDAEQWEILEEYATQWVNWDANANQAWLHRAQAAKKLGQLDKTAEMLGRVTDDFDEALGALSAQADLLFTEMNQPLAAVAAWKRMHKINPSASRPYQRLLYFYAMTLQRQKMIDIAYDAIERGCEPPEAYSYLVMANGLRFSDGFFEATKWLQSHPDDENLRVAQAYYDAKQTSSGTIPLFGIGKLSKTMDHYREVYPKNLEVLAYIIETQIHQGKTDKLPELLASAPPTAEKDSRFWRYRGWYLMHAGEDQKAAEAVEKAIEIYKLDWRHWLEYSSILRKLNRLEEAARAAEVARIGKLAERKVLELATPAKLDGESAKAVYDFIVASGEQKARASFERRLRGGR